MEELRTCSRCHVAKSLSEFYRKGEERLQAWCKPCFNAHSAAWQKANPDRVRAATRAYAAKHPERIKAYRQKRREKAQEYGRMRDFGLTSEAYGAMMDAQGGHCAICDRVLDRGRNTHVDHCHKTDRVRGILCRDCNHILGLARDSVATLTHAAEYLQAAKKRESV